MNAQPAAPRDAGGPRWTITATLGGALNELRKKGPTAHDHWRSPPACRASTSGVRGVAKGN